MDLLLFDLVPEDGRGVLVTIDEAESTDDVVQQLSHRRSEIAGCNIIVIRPHVAIQRSATLLPEEHESFRILKARFPGSSIFLLASQRYAHEISSDLSDINESEFASAEKRQELVDLIRQQELVRFVHASNALLPRSRSHNYRHPSGVFCDSFLRVGNIQTSRHVLDVIFYWMLPHLKSVHGIVTETWSIGSTALNVARLISQYDSSKQGFRIEMLSHYTDGRAGTRLEIEKTVRRISSSYEKKFLIVYSASKTGNSIQRLIDALDVASCPPHFAEILVMYRLGPASILLGNKVVPDLCVLPQEDGYFEPSPDRDPIEIDAETFFPKIVAEADIGISKDVASASKEFFDRYRTCSTIRIHSNAYVADQFFRHHAFMIDLVEMLRIRDFVLRLEAVLDSLDPAPHMIVVPPHDAGEALAAEVAAYFKKKSGSKPAVCITLDMVNCLSSEGGRLEALSGKVVDHLAGIDEDSAILVLDDVVTTGSRVLAFQRALRETYEGRIHYLFGVSRMESESRWSHVKSTLRQNNHGPQHTVNAVEHVVLPDWGRDHCPWCQEQKVLDELAAAGEHQGFSISATMQLRANTLRNADRSGLTDEVFIEGDPSHPMVLTPNSFFVKAPALPSVVTAAAASAIQQMRTSQIEERRLDPRGYPLRRVLPLSDISRRYTDPILRAAILRVSTPNELRRSKQATELERATWFRERLTGTDATDVQLRREVLMGILLEKVPIETLDVATIRFLKVHGHEEFCNLVEQRRL
jgi:hypothetical protein